MIYVSLPKKFKIENLNQLESCNSVVELFKRHGLGIAYFGSEGVSFYDTSKRIVENGVESVPISSFYKMSKKEFLIFVNVVRRLDASERKANELIKFAARGI